MVNRKGKKGRFGLHSRYSRVRGFGAFEYACIYKVNRMIEEINSKTQVISSACLSLKSKL